VESLDPETGDVQWKWVVTPDKGDPALSTWPSAEAALVGSGGVWQPPSYDPQLNLMYITTGQPTPTYNGRNRPGTNLYTCSVVALNPDTGKMAWYYQFSPHDTHDWDGTEVPVLIDGTFNGQLRKLLAQANRNGYYYLLDRTNGKALVVKRFAWSNSYKGVDANNVLIPDPDKESSPGGTLVFPDSSGATNYPSPAFDPDTGLFYVNTTDTGSFFYAPHDPTDPSGFGRGLEYRMDLGFSTLQALDYRTGEPRWTHKYPTTSWFSSTYPGMLATAGGVLFTGDPAGNFVAYDSKTGASLWHAPMGGPITNSPQTLMMDGKQYVLIAAKDTYYAFYLQ
jgi:alcohol dehydrogenase (cytochrome c)